MWDAQCETKPLVRPLFSIDCDFMQLKTSDYRKMFQQKLTMITTVISGCARDSYVLLAHGLTPTFPKVLQGDESLRKMLLAKENKPVLDFILNDYRNTIQSLTKLESPKRIFTDDERTFLIGQLDNATKMIEKL